MKNNTNLLISLLIILSCIIGIFNKSLFFDISINLFVIISFAILIIIEYKKGIHNNITYHIIILTFINHNIINIYIFIICIKNNKIRY